MTHVLLCHLTSPILTMFHSKYLDTPFKTQNKTIILYGTSLESGECLNPILNTYTEGPWLNVHHIQVAAIEWRLNNNNNFVDENTHKKAHLHTHLPIDPIKPTGLVKPTGNV